MTEEFRELGDLRAQSWRDGVAVRGLWVALDADGGEGSAPMLVLAIVGAQAQAPAPETPLVPLFSLTASPLASSSSLLAHPPSSHSSRTSPAFTMSSLPTVYIVSSARTPLGMFQGYVGVPANYYPPVADSPPALWAA